VLQVRGLAVEVAGRLLVEDVSFTVRARDKIGLVGAHNSLSQLVLKLASPGVPDIYQGSELWDLSLVDPDNRRPVDFETRNRILQEVRDDQKPRAELARELYQSWPDGRIKLFLTQSGLRTRRDNPGIFGDGEYLPLEPQGNRAERLVALEAYRTQRARPAILGTCRTTS